MSNIKLLELVEDEWIERDNLDFNLVIVGDTASKIFCFSPINNDILNLKAKIKEKKDFSFLGSDGYVSCEWKNIEPSRIKKGERSESVKIEFSVKSGPVRMDFFEVILEYLEVPEI